MIGRSRTKKGFTMRQSFLMITTAALVFAGCTPAQKPQSIETTASELSAAIEQGKPVRCTLKKKDGTQSMDYVMDGKKIKMSGVEIAGKKQTGTMISDASYFYMWEEGATTGIQMKLPEEGKVVTNPDTIQSVPDFSNDSAKKMYEDQGYTFDCKSTTVSTEEFTPPTTVSFTDTSVMLDAAKLLQEGTTASPEETKEFEEMLKQFEQKNR